ncbi:MAG: hypothetical protein M1835_002377 [Candelina submexicana]|nr:MAG: hypothetical protein M1835_002377 [Candelina submexicana]
MILSVAREVPVPINVPMEILLNIFSNLPGKAVKNVRLVCKDFEIVASPYLFTRAFISPLRKDLDVFTHVMRHAIFSRTVREIVWNVVALNTHCKEKRHWNIWLQAHLRARGFSEVNVSDFDRHYRAYCQTVDDFETTIESGEAFGTLCVGLVLMSQVEVIRITDDSSQHNAGYDTSAVFGSSMAPLPTVPWNTYPQLRLRDLTTAVSIARPKIKEFRVMKGERVPHRSLRLSEQDLVHIRNAFRGLLKLEVRLDIYSWEAKWQPTRARCNIATALLAGAPSLESLEFAFAQSSDEPDPLENILGTQVYSRLRTFKLTVFHLTMTELLNFIKMHSKTLRQLVIVNVQVSDGTWKEFLDSLRLFPVQLYGSRFDVLGASDERLIPEAEEIEAFLEHGGRNSLIPSKDTRPY